MKYTVQYKLQGQWFWRKITNVKGDIVATDLGTPMRILILEDESRVEIPITGTQFRFCSKRFLSIKLNMEKEAGQTIPVR